MCEYTIVEIFSLFWLCIKYNSTLYTFIKVYKSDVFTVKINKCKIFLVILKMNREVKDNFI